MCVESRNSGHISFADNLAFHAVYPRAGEMERSDWLRHVLSD